jgi:hypothetical protein
LGQRITIPRLFLRECALGVRNATHPPVPARDAIPATPSTAALFDVMGANARSFHRRCTNMKGLIQKGTECLFD